ncbi:MAG: hypothetical protein O3A63_18350 [Proteobacteria bacterium]|nr:hypothetical protein [Pseudomonadota bacterium]
MKIFLWFVGIVALLVVGAGVFIAMNLGDLVKTQVETLGSQALQTKVSVDAIDFSASDASAEIRGLSVANPPGYSSDNALGFSNFKVAVSPEQTSGEVVVLR